MLVCFNCNMESIVTMVMVAKSNNNHLCENALISCSLKWAHVKDQLLSLPEPGDYFTLQAHFVEQLAI